MSDQPTSTTEGNEPDGFVIIHTPPDGSDAYGVGPFPWDEGLAEALIEHGPCPCRKVALSVAFPKGITMLVEGVDIKGVMEAMEMMAAIAEEEERRDRLN